MKLSDIKPLDQVIEEHWLASSAWSSPQIARLEKAEHQPSFETLARLTRATGLQFRFEVDNGAVELVSA